MKTTSRKTKEGTMSDSKIDDKIPKVKPKLGTYYIPPYCTFHRKSYEELWPGQFHCEACLEEALENKDERGLDDD